MDTSESGGGANLEEAVRDPLEGVAEDPEQRRRQIANFELTREDDGGIRLGALYIPPPPPPALTFDNDRPRLIITHIENENFKSYAGLQTLGPFHKSFTSIVGPNGSGKSNVIDSMLFVFGYRAQKIRSKKISVLIHESEKHPNLRSCTVRVFFQEILDSDPAQEGGVPVEGSQFSVSRTAFKDNSSFYEIDGKRRQFKDVAELLKRKGVDLDHNRFLILQGEVEQIAQMKPKGVQPNDTGMLEFLEDIIGSSRFKEPIDLLKETVGELDEMRSEKLNRVKLVEKEKDELEEPKNKAIEYIKLENEIAEKKNLGYQLYILDCENKIEQVQKQQQEYEASAAEVLSEVEKVINARKELEDKHKEKTTELNATQDKLEEAQEAFKKHEMEDTKIREEMKNLNTKRKKLKKAMENEKEKLEKLEGVPESNRVKIEECEVLRDKLTAQQEEDQKKYDLAMEEVTKETQAFQDEKEPLETKLIDLRKNENEKKEALKLKQSELDLLNSKEAKEQARLDQLQLNREQAAKKLSDLKEQNAELEKDVPAARKQLASLESKLEKANEREAECAQRARQLHGKCEEQKSSAHAARSRGRVLEALMVQKGAGTLTGIFGRLGDLGTIDKQYDVAISTATGNSLDTILVDTVDTAAKCIQFLKDQNIGRANFLALDKANQWASKCQQRISTPENVPRLFDLIRMQDDRFSPAFYHYVRDTLVADSLDQAQRIAFGAKRFRVVTTNGEVIETTGAMAGGGREVARGKMGSVPVKTASSDEIRALEEALRKANDEHDAIIQSRNEIDQMLIKARKTADDGGHKLERNEIDLKALEKKMKGLEEQIQKQKAVVEKAKPEQKALKLLKTTIEKLTKDHDQAAEKSSSIYIEIKKIEAKIKEVMGTKVKSIKRKLDEVKTKLDKLKNEMTRLEVDIKSSTRQAEKSKDKVEAYETEVKECEEKMRNMNETRQALETKGIEAISNLESLKKKQKEMMAEGEELAKAIEKKKLVEAKAKSKQLEINQEREKFSSEIKEQSKTISHWKRERKRLKLRAVPGEDSPTELQDHPEEELRGLDMKKWQYEINLKEEKLASLKVNFSVIEEYRKKEDLYLERVAELEDISRQKEKQRRNHEDLRKMRLNEFMEGFSIITAKLKEMYQMITLGGDAELELVDSLDPFTEGIVFSVRPPSKSWKNISNLSGGEKTLSSLALVFALHFYKPTPLYVMDEIDAALDFKNVSIVANYIRERTKNAQFIIISLRSNMFELADRLVGIYKTYNCTKSVTINPGILAAQQQSI